MSAPFVFEPDLLHIGQKQMKLLLVAILFVCAVAEAPQVVREEEAMAGGRERRQTIASGRGGQKNVARGVEEAAAADATSTFGVETRPRAAAGRVNYMITDMK